MIPARTTGAPRGRATTLPLVLLGVAIAAPIVPGVPAALAAQSVGGVVVESGSERPIAGALVRLLDRDGRRLDQVVTDEDGDFLLVGGRGGVYALVAEMLGYATVRTDSLRLGDGEQLRIQVRMAVEAVPVEPIVVTSRRAASGALRGFYDRMERSRRSGSGHFITRQDIDESSATAATDLLRMAPGVRVQPARSGGGGGTVRMSGNCIPALFVDGTQINRYPNRGESLDHYVPILSIEGIEVYRGAAQQVGHYHDPNGCGMVLVWTRRGTQQPGPFSWKKLFAGLAILAALLLLR